MTKEDEIQWNQRIEKLSEEHAEPYLYELNAACWAIARCPFPWIHDTMLRINGGMFLAGEHYDRVLSALICDGILRPKSYLTFSIDRKRIPQEIEEYALSIPLLVGVSCPS